MIIIPELELVRIITLGVEGIALDYESAVNKDDSILAKLFKGIKYEKLNFYDQAVVLFVTNRKFTQSSSNRKITIRSYYDRTIRNTPAIHISAPTENETQMSVGGGFGEYDDQLVDGVELVQSRRKSYESKNAVFFTSDNHIEVQIMYYTVRSMLQSIFDSFALTTHQNAKMTGNELRMEDPGMAPQHIFARALFIDSFTEMLVPNFFYSEIFSKLNFERPTSQEDGIISSNT